MKWFKLGSMSKDYLTAQELAKRLDVKTTTIWAWVRDGSIPAVRLGKNGHRLRFIMSDVNESLKKYGKDTHNSR